MGYYDAQQVCLKGHQTTSRYHGSPQFRQPFCSKCGTKTIHQCPKCNTDIPGYYHVDGVFSMHETPVPGFCENCGTEFPWAEAISDDAVTKLAPSDAVERICNRIPLVIRQIRERYDNRSTLDVENEYDLQDLMHSLLHLFFDDIRPEEYSPSYAGKATRMDFLLKNESIVVETKMTRRGLAAKEIGEELIIDIARYKGHPKCESLYCLVYDPDHRIKNPRGIENDLSKETDGVAVKVFIVPK